MSAECVGFIECRCPKCLACPAQQEAKRRVAAIRGGYCRWCRETTPATLRGESSCNRCRDAAAIGSGFAAIGGVR